jgi:hypothetical protein
MGRKANHRADHCQGQRQKSTFLCHVSSFRQQLIRVSLTHLLAHVSSASLQVHRQAGKAVQNKNSSDKRLLTFAREPIKDVII